MTLGPVLIRSRRGRRIPKATAADRGRCSG